MASPATGICSLGNQMAGFYLGKGGLDSHLPHGKNRDTTLADKRPTLGRQQPAEPKETSMEPAYHAYHAYHAHFCHFPRSPALRKPSAASGTPERRRKIAVRGLTVLTVHFLAISREARKASAASAGQRNAEKSRLRKPGAHRAHFLATSREPPGPFPPARSRQTILTHRAWGAIVDPSGVREGGANPPLPRNCKRREIEPIC